MVKRDDRRKEDEERIKKTSVWFGGRKQTKWEKQKQNKKKRKKKKKKSKEFQLEWHFLTNYTFLSDDDEVAAKVFSSEIWLFYSCYRNFAFAYLFFLLGLFLFLFVCFLFSFHWVLIRDKYRVSKINVLLLFFFITFFFVFTLFQSSYD